jgi:hypothetical protein
MVDVNMANKMQIKKFLELKRNEATDKLKSESIENQEHEKDLFFEAYKEQFSAIKENVIKAGTEYDRLTKSIADLSLADTTSWYNTPGHEFNTLINKLSLENLRTSYIEVKKVKIIESQYNKRVNSTAEEYDNLIAICQANNAADSLKILENLGFNISEIEVKKVECTALITNIDASKLFV